ncbi:MAG: AbrB/MazE/SpoVT family DNA-binding domain-containing protein [Calditrichia bacterium]
MKFSTFNAEIGPKNSIEIPAEVREKLDLRPGDKLEVTVKKIKTRRLEILISENPLYKLMKFENE